MPNKSVTLSASACQVSLHWVLSACECSRFVVHWVLSALGVLGAQCTVQFKCTHCVCLFVCLFVCLYKTRKSILRSLCFEGSNNPWEWLHTESGAVAQKLIRHGPRAWHWRQRHKPRTCQSMANTLQVDGLARITGLTPAPIQRRILNHRNNHPHHAHVSSWHVYGMGRT